MGDYKLRVQVTDPDGVSGSSQPLDIRVAAGFEPSIKMISPINEDTDYLQEGEFKIDSFTYPSTAVFTFESHPALRPLSSTSSAFLKPKSPPKHLSPTIWVLTLWTL
jgi:hypothetical protein